MVYCTDGILRERLKKDKLLSGVRCVIIDEAHERTSATDIVLGRLKALLPERKDLKVIIMSATLDADMFRNYFGGPERVPLLTIAGRTHPVKIVHCDVSLNDYVNCAVRAVLAIHHTKPKGDILVFMPGKDEAAFFRAGLQNEIPYGLDVLLLHGAMPAQQQKQALSRPAGISPSTRRCIAATNIAEASVTIDDIVYVVDTGLARVMQYNPRLRAQRLELVPITKANAKQRAGRAGRTQPGVCYRLYTAEFFETMVANPTTQLVLEHQGQNILHLLALGVEDILKFDFIDPPAAETMYVYHLGENGFWLGT